MVTTSLKLYNTKSRSIEPFVPADPACVRIYVCGLTPSAQAHLGHARSFLFFDVLRNYLKLCGYGVRFVQNVTDVDDRSINAARAEGTDWRDVVDRYYRSFKASMRELGVAEPDAEPRATEYIDAILAMLDGLIEKGLAYASSDGVYFSVRSFPKYGALSGRNVDDLLVGARIAPGEDKRDPLDFALWKFEKPDEPSWPSRYGAGRPGWHIECSAMLHELLGEPIDIHGGGFDLIFPHHENEIAQTEGLLGVPMARYWVHGGLLMFDNRKMSKSLGNFEPLGALLDRHDPRAIRLLFLQTGYRKPMNFTEESIAGATTALERLRAAYRGFVRAGDGAALSAFEARNDPAVAAARERMCANLDDDMNTSGAVSVLFDFARENAAAAPAAAAFFREACELLGLWDERMETSAQPGRAEFDAGFRSRLEAEVGALVHVNGDGPETVIEAAIDARNAARKNKDFALADKLRDALAAAKVVLKDSREGTTWTVVE